MGGQIGHRIRKAREDASLTAEQMAPLVGVTMGTLLRYEKGTTQRISVDRLTVIARVTGKPLGYFLSENGQEAA